MSANTPEYPKQPPLWQPEQEVPVSSQPTKSESSGCLVTFAALGTAAFLVASVLPQYPGTRLFLDEITPTGWTISECDPGWNGQAADPIEFARGFRAVSSPIHKEDTSIRAAELAGSAPDLEYGSPEYQRQDNLGSASNGLDYFTDEPSEVTCELPGDGRDFVVNEEATRLLKKIEAAGYGVDPMTGEFTTP